MRITGGRLKGWQIQGGFAAHVRPSTDRVRESLFNHLQHAVGIEDLDILDLFSGSGIIALEFLSRAAAAVTSVDRDEKNIRFQKILKQEKDLKNWEIQKMDAIKYLESTEKQFHLVFADPPYNMPNLQNLVMKVIPHLSSEGWFYLEHKPGILFSIKPDWVKSYGSTCISAFQKPGGRE